MLGLLALQGCLFYPRTQRAIEEEKCKPISKQWVLDHEKVSLRGIGSCSGEACLYLLATIGAVVATTYVVSGSVVVAGNTVYWLETQAGCPLARMVKGGG